MGQNHEDAAAELHATLEQRNGSIGNRGSVDMAGAKLDIKEKEADFDGKDDADVEAHDLDPSEEGMEPNEHEKKTLRRIGDKFPKSAYLIAVVELCERFTCKL